MRLGPSAGLSLRLLLFLPPLPCRRPFLPAFYSLLILSRAPHLLRRFDRRAFLFHFEAFIKDSLPISFPPLTLLDLPSSFFPLILFPLP